MAKGEQFKVRMSRDRLMLWSGDFVGSLKYFSLDAVVINYLC